MTSRDRRSRGGQNTSGHAKRYDGWNGESFADAHDSSGPYRSPATQLTWVSALPRI
jgi:hypothetical protein